MKKLKPVRLVLGGGAALGLAHIGVLKALQEDYLIKGIVGTSMGAIIGGLYAYGYSPEELLHIAMESKFNSFLRIRLDVLKNGILSTTKLSQFFSDLTNQVTIEKCKIPFMAVSFDLKSQQTFVLKSGELASAMIASSNLPFLNKPFLYAGGELVDGGICYPLPMEFVDFFDQSTPVIAVNVLPDLPENPLIDLNPATEDLESDPGNLIYNTMKCNLYNQANLALVSLQRRNPDIYISCFSEELKAWDFGKAEHFYRFGLDKAQSILISTNKLKLLDELMAKAKEALNRIIPIPGVLTTNEHQ